MNVHFSSNIKHFAGISTDAAQNPILYRSGYKAFELTPKEIGVLREYVANGGTIIFNPLVGSPDAYQSALQAARAILPEERGSTMAVLPSSLIVEEYTRSPCRL